MNGNMEITALGEELEQDIQDQCDYLKKNVPQIYAGIYGNPEVKKRNGVFSVIYTETNNLKVDDSKMPEVVNIFGQNYKRIETPLKKENTIIFDFYPL